MEWPRLTIPIVSSPSQLLVCMLAGWLNRQQRDVTEYQREKKINWSRFLTAHWEELLAADLFTTEVLCRSGLVTNYTLFVIELKTLLVHICGSTPNPDGEWMLQIAGNLTDCETGFAGGKSHLI